eukprot:GHVN01022235.1.p1 GENE.GHVN01022235.1~~GHVN01022235.1.p1  ORF type:complete len:394 (+),score=39.85 GHVN01022235.1:114-1295(+)
MSEGRAPPVARVKRRSGEETTPQQEIPSPETHPSQDDSSTGGSGSEENPPARREADDRGPYVLYLAGVTKKKYEGFEDAVGADRIRCPEMGLMRMIIVFTIVYVVVGILLLLVTISTFLTSSALAGVLTLAISALLMGLLYFGGSRTVTYLMLWRSLRVAERERAAFGPNIIVAVGFGAVAALRLKGSKLPMVGALLEVVDLGVPVRVRKRRHGHDLFGAQILLHPAQDAFSRYMHSKARATIQRWPFTVIVHGQHRCLMRRSLTSNSGDRDRRIPLTDSIRLVESCAIGRCRLEVPNDDHRLDSVTSEDISAFISEAYDRGKQEVSTLYANGRRDVDPAVFVKGYVPPVASSSGRTSTSSAKSKGKAAGKKSRDRSVDREEGPTVHDPLIEK